MSRLKLAAARSVPVALALNALSTPAQAAAMPEKARATSEPDHHVFTSSGRGFTSNLHMVIEETPHTASTNSDSIDVPFSSGVESWEEFEEQYDSLVTQEAIGSITVEQLRELDRLQRLRRRLDSPASGEELIERHKREKMDRELIEVLSRYVRIEPLPKDSA